MLSDVQRETLLKPLMKHRVSEVKGMAYLEAFDVIAHLTRIFGFEGWDKEIIRLDIIHETEGVTKRDNQPPKPNWTVAYRCAMRLTVRDPYGLVIKLTEDVGTGEAINQPSRGDAHDLASKSAVSGALKRCAKDLGDQFGLGLYDGGSLEPCLKRVVIYDTAPPRTPKDDNHTESGQDQPSPTGAASSRVASEPPVSELISNAQRAKLYATSKEKKVDPHGVCASVLDHPVESINEITKSEAHLVIEYLVALPKPA